MDSDCNQTYAINGNPKFFEPSKSMLKNGVRATASTGDEANYILNLNTYTRWVSTGSDDTTIETLTITFPEPTTINRLHIGRHNWKKYKITYDADDKGFEDVISLKSMLPIDEIIGVLVNQDGDVLTTETGDVLTTSFQPIYETDYDLPVSYYEFDEITTTQIKIQIFTTQTPDDEKWLERFIATTEIGTFEHPMRRNLSINSNNSEMRVMSGKHIIQRGFDSHSCSLTMNANDSQADSDLCDELYDRTQSFLFWMIGGVEGYRQQQKGWLHEDIWLAQTSARYAPKYHGDITSLFVKKTLELKEVVS